MYRCVWYVQMYILKLKVYWINWSTQQERSASGNVFGNLLVVVWVLKSLAIISALIFSFSFLTSVFCLIAVYAC